MSVADQRQVADIRAFIDFHGFAPFRPRGAGRPRLSDGGQLCFRRLLPVSDSGRRNKRRWRTAQPEEPAKPPMLTQPKLPPQGRGLQAPALISQEIMTARAAEPSANLRWARCVTYSVFTDLKLWGSRVFILNQHVSSNRQDSFVAHACRRRGANRAGRISSAGACVLRP